MNLLRDRSVEVGRVKPHIQLLSGRYGDWLCWQLLGGSTVSQTGHTPRFAYHRFSIYWNSVRYGGRWYAPTPCQSVLR